MIDGTKLSQLEDLLLAIHALEWARADATAALLKDASEADVRAVAELLGVGHRSLKNWKRLAGVRIRPPDQAPWVSAHEVGIYATGKPVEPLESSA